MNDWIEWHGGECPVDGEVRVDAKHRDGICSENQKAEWWKWDHKGYCEDIISYRVSDQCETAQATS